PLLALFAAAAQPAAATAQPPPRTVTGVVVQPAPPDTIERRPDAVARSVGGEDEALGDYVAVWPRAAYRAGKDGPLTLACLIDVHGLAEWCRVAAEQPPGLGFGKAALELKPTFKLKPAQGPNGPVAKVMSINVSFRQPDFQFDQADLARQMWDATHNPG